MCTEFFKNIVRPLFELWNQFLSSKLSRQLISNLDFNDYMWNTMEKNERPAKKQLSKRSNSVPSIDKLHKLSCDSLKRSKSLVSICSISLSSVDSGSVSSKEATDKGQEKTAHKCVNGCGTPPACKEEKTSLKDKLSKLDDIDYEEEDDFITDRFNDDCGAILSTPALLLPNYYDKKVALCCIPCN